MKTQDKQHFFEYTEICIRNASGQNTEGDPQRLVEIETALSLTKEEILKKTLGIVLGDKDLQ